MKILGIDPGTATTGYGIVESADGDLRCIIYGCIATPARTAEEERLLILHSELRALIKKYKPQQIAIERLYFFKNQKTIIEVSQARGAVLTAAALEKVPLSSFTPPQVKQAVTSYGQAEKRQVQIMVRRLLGLKETPKPDDAADALALAICALNSNL